MAKLKSTTERGRFKQEIHAALYKSKDIKELLLGDTSAQNASKVKEGFRDHVKSHLFIDDTIIDTSSFIYYDVRMPRLESNIKHCQVVLYAICHRDILDNYEKEGYYGNRADILSQMIEDCLINNEGVLVHGKKGASRSAYLVKYFLMLYNDYKSKEAEEFIKNKRPIAFPSYKNISKYEKIIIPHKKLFKQYFNS